MEKVRPKNKVFKKAYEIKCIKMLLAQKIAGLRKDKKLTQAGLAKRLGIPKRCISQIEAAEEKSLTLEVLIAIALSLGRSIHISFPGNSKH